MALRYEMPCGNQGPDRLLALKFRIEDIIELGDEPNPVVLAIKKGLPKKESTSGIIKDFDLIVSILQIL
jgi:hypothetical protein